MTLDLDRVRSRGLAIAVLIAALVLAAEILVVPAVSYFRSARAERDHSLHQLAKLQALVDAAPAMDQALAQLDAHAIWQHLYPVGGSATLQQDFRMLVDAQKITLDSVQPLDPATAGDFDKLILKVAFNTTIDRLGHLMLAMQASPHALRFENLYVTAPLTQNGNQNATLVVRGDVVGYGRSASTP